MTIPNSIDSPTKYVANVSSCLDVCLPVPILVCLIKCVSVCLLSCLNRCLRALSFSIGFDC